MKFGFLFIMLAIFISIAGYVITRGCQALPGSGVWRALYAGTSIVLFLSFFAGLFLGERMPLGLASAVSFAGNTYLVIMIYLLFSFLAADLIRLVNTFGHFAPAGMQAFRFWWMMGSFVIIAVTLIIGNYKFNHPAIEKLSIQSSKPEQHKELKIVAISDLHVGFSIQKKKLQQYVSLINAQQPDIVLIAGDFTDRPVGPVTRQHMEEELRQIKAPLGIYAINGNHEFYAEQPGATAAFLQQAGVHSLVDSVALVNNSFYVVGRDDRTNTARKPLAELVKGLNPALPVILLDHQPHHLEEAEHNHVDLQLSGHTHEGQFFPGNLIVKRMFEQPHGYLRKGNTHFFVSSGLGIWGPQYRIGTQSEIVVVTMKY